MTESSINGGYEYTTDYVPKGAEDSDGSRAVTHRRGLTVKQTLLSAAGGLVLAATLTACGPASEPTPTGTSTEAPTPAPAETLTEKSLELPATLTPEQTAVAIENNFSKVTFAGLDEKEIIAYNVARYGKDGGKDDQAAGQAVLLKLSTDNVGLLKKAMFVDPTTNDTDPFLQFKTGADAVDMEIFALSYLPSTDHYTHTQEVVPGSVVVKDDTATSRTMQYQIIEHSNAANIPSLDKFSPDALKLEGATYIVTVTLQIVGGKQEISAIHFA